MTRTRPELHDHITNCTVSGSDLNNMAAQKLHLCRFRMLLTSLWRVSGWHHSHSHIFFDSIWSKATSALYMFQSGLNFTCSDLKIVSECKEVVFPVQPHYKKYTTPIGTPWGQALLKKDAISTVQLSVRVLLQKCELYKFKGNFQNYFSLCVRC